MAKAKRAVTPKDALDILEMHDSGANRKIDQKSVSYFVKQMKQKARAAGINFVDDNSPKLSKKLSVIAKKAVSEPIIITINQALAQELWALRLLRKREIEIEWLRVWYFAFLMISKEFHFSKDFAKVVQIDNHSYELLSGSHELAAFIISGMPTIKLAIYFPSPMDYGFIDTGKKR